MNPIKSHFVFSKAQRSGIFILLFVIVALQVVCYYIERPSPIAHVDQEALRRYEAEIDSLRHVALKRQTPKTYPFNPNYITDYKGSLLGLTPLQIDRLLAFRKANQWIQNANDFQKVTGVSDTLLQQLQPYFKFPKPRFKTTSVSKHQAKIDVPVVKHDLNKATAEELQKVYGIGAVLSQRIIRYRDKVGGRFAHRAELYEVYGLTAEVIERITTKFEIQTPRAIKQHDLNTATVDELVTIKYIDYDSAYAIVSYRTLHEGFKSLAELSKVKEIPISKIDLIKLSLQIK